MPDLAGLLVVAQPAVALVSSLGAAAERVGDLRPCRSCIQRPSDGQLPLGGQVAEASGEDCDRRSGGVTTST